MKLAQTLMENVARRSVQYIEKSEELNRGSVACLEFKTQANNVLRLTLRGHEVQIETPTGYHYRQLQTFEHEWLFRKTQAALVTDFGPTTDFDDTNYNIRVQWTIRHLDQSQCSFGGSIDVDGGLNDLLDLWLTDAACQIEPYSITAAPEVEPELIHGPTKDVECVIMNYVRPALHALESPFKIHGVRQPILTIGKTCKGTYGISSAGTLIWTVKDGEDMARWLNEVLGASYNLISANVRKPRYNLTVCDWHIPQQEWPQSQSDLETLCSSDNSSAMCLPQNPSITNRHEKHIAFALAIGKHAKWQRFRLIIDNQTLEIERQQDPNHLKVVGFCGHITTVARHIVDVLVPKPSRIIIETSK